MAEWYLFDGSSEIPPSEEVQQHAETVSPTVTQLIETVAQLRQEVDYHCETIGKLVELGKAYQRHIMFLHQRIQFLFYAAVFSCLGVVITAVLVAFLAKR